jgi:hypothetical protein
MRLHPTVTFAVAVALASYLAGAAAFGLRAPAAAEPAPPSAGCTEKTLKFVVTDDETVHAEQMRFERRLSAESPALPAPGLHPKPVDPVASLHAASHGYIVVYFRARKTERGLGTIARQAVAQKIPLLAAPREQQRDALVAVREGMELRCSSGGPEQLARLRAFGAAVYPGLAE